MIHILKFAKHSWHIMLFIVALLYVQTQCELALPAYTSRIVDVGIQTGGIESPVPIKMRESTYQVLALFMEDTQKALMESAYTKEGDFYVLQNSGEPLLHHTENDFLSDEELQDLFLEKGVLAAMLYGEGEQAVAARTAMLTSMGLPQDSDLIQALLELPHTQQEAFLQELKTQAENAASQMFSSIQDAAAIAFVMAEYHACGIDTDALQMKYLKEKGFQMLLLALLGMVMAGSVIFLSAKLAGRTATNLRDRVFERVVGFSNEEVGKFSTASLITRCTNDIQQIQMVFMMMFRIIIYAPLLGLGGVMQVMRTETGMTWIIGVALGAVLFVVLTLMVLTMPKFKAMQELIDKLNLVSREILTGIPVIRAFAREGHEEKRFDLASTNLKKTQFFTACSMSFMMPTMMLIMNAAAALIVWTGAHGIDEGVLLVGDMMAFITYTMLIIMSFLMLTIVAIMLPRAIVSAGRIQEVLDTPISIRDANAPLELRKDSKGAVSFHEVCFTYQDAEEEVLTNVTFTANPGETTAIIGSTGCGKSTLVQLIPRLYDVTSGSVCIDGKDVRKLRLTKLREIIGYVPQKAILFSGTIASNIGFGQTESTQACIEEAAEVAQATEFINQKEKKYEDEIAQGGTNVSGGQKQRLSIARAIAKHPKIYVFDDSFSALDYKTDNTLRSALKEKTKHATVIIVAQRISTILHAEKIVVLDEGKVVGIGTHEELLKDNDVYYQIASTQLSEEDLEKATAATRKGDF